MIEVSFVHSGVEFSKVAVQIYPNSSTLKGFSHRHCPEDNEPKSPSQGRSARQPTPT